MINKIGVRAHDYGRLEINQLLQDIKTDNWQSIQLAFAKAVADVNTSADITQNHFDIINNSDISVSVLGSYVELGMVDDASRKAEVSKFISNIAIAKAVNATCIGSETTAFATQPKEAPRDALKALYSSLNEILPVAQEVGVTVGIEPVFWHTLSTPQLAKQLIKDMQSNYLKIIFDPINLLAPSLLSRQEYLWSECIDAFGEHTVAMHFKGVQYEGNTAVSCPLKQSQADMSFVINALQKLPNSFDVLREEAQKSSAAEDIAYIKELISRA